MRVRSLVTAMLVFTALAAVAVDGYAQTETPATPERTPQEYQTPESYVERMKKQGTILEMSLKEAIRLALANNLEIEIENYNEDLNREQVVKTKGFYDPGFTFRTGWRSSESPTTRTLDAGGGISVSKFDSLIFNSSLAQNVRGGGSIQLAFNNSSVDTNDSFAFVNPRYNSDFGVTFIQPLWRGFRKTNTERQIQIFNLDTKISDTQFKQRVAEIVQQVQNQYWELVYSIENYETQRQSVELAIIQYRNNTKRVQIGVMAPIEITSSQAEVARREQTLIQSQVQIINAQNALKHLLASDPQASIWDLTLIPTDKPQLKEVTLGMDQAIETAARNRPELERIRYQVEQNEINRSYYRKDGKPAVNLQASFGSVGATGADTGHFPVDPNDPRIGSFGGAWNQVFSFDFIQWNVYAEVEIPIRNRSNDADLATAAIRDRQLQSTLRNQQQLIMVEVRNAFETIATRKESLKAATVARQLSEEQLAGETKRFEAGLSTNFEVLRFQRDLAENQVSELRAMIDYQLALIALEKAMYTIIEDSDILVARRE